MPHVANITVYPIKALDGVSLTEAVVLPSGGLQHDRQWAMFDAEGNFINGSAASAGGSIGSVNLQQVNTVNNTRAFGVIAQDALAKLRVNQQNVPAGFHQDDFYIAVLNQ
jgi:uncharacterized protein YcbX